MASIPYSVLDLASVVQGDNIQQTFEKSVQSARVAEALGYTRYWFSEHHNMLGVASAATALLISYVAGKTKTMRIGSGGIMLPNHAPLIVAEQFGTLDAFYPGRIDLGLGRAPGTDNPATIAIRKQHAYQPYDFKAHILELQQYFSKENNTNKVRAIPGEGANIPLWILGSSTESAYLAAELGLPYAFAAHFAPAQMMAAFEIYNRLFKPSAQLQKPCAMACLSAIAADSNEEAQYLATSMYQGYLGIITDARAPMKPPVSVEAMEQLWSPQQKAAVQQMTSYAVIGNKNEVEQQLHYFIQQTGIKELMVISQVYDQQKKHYSLKLIAEAMKGVKQ